MESESTKPEVAKEVRTETLCWAIPCSVHFEQAEFSTTSAPNILLVHLYYHVIEMLGTKLGKKCQFAVKLVEEPDGIAVMFRPEDALTDSLFCPFRIRFQIAG